MQFFDIYSLNEAIKLRIKSSNQTRMQQKDYCREEKYLAEEKPLLSPLPTEAFELKSYRELKVAKNNHIYLSEDKHYYSVPYRLIGVKVKVLYTARMVRIYHEGKQVAAHIRNTNVGYSTIGEHLCSQHRHFRDRSPNYYKSLASKQSPVLSRLFNLIFSQNRYPEQLYRTCDGLLDLGRKSDTESFRLACQTAIDHEVYSYTFIKNIIANNMAGQRAEPAPKNLPDHGNLRGREHFENELKNQSSKRK